MTTHLKHEINKLDLNFNYLSFAIKKKMIVMRKNNKRYRKEINIFYYMRNKHNSVYTPKLAG